MGLGWGSPEGVDLSFKASEAMTNAFIAVKLDTSNPGCISIAGDGESAIGILQVALAVGEAGAVRISDTSKVKANGAFSIGDLLNSAASTGLVDTKGSTEHAIAIALEAATAQNDLCLALVRQVYV